MENKTILYSYQDWLQVHEMPAGKKKTKKLIKTGVIFVKKVVFLSP